MISGTLTVLVWSYIPMINVEGELVTLGDSTGLYSLALGFPIALVMMVLVSLITKKPDQEIIDEFESVKTLDV